MLGLDHTSSLDEVEAVFGRGLTWPAPSGELTDTGLVEFGWWDGRVTYFGAQAHRLPFLRGDAGKALVAQYGRFRKRLLLRDVDLAVRARGFRLVERPSAAYVEFVEPTLGSVESRASSARRRPPR